MSIACCATKDSTRPLRTTGKRLARCGRRSTFSSKAAVPEAGTRATILVVDDDPTVAVTFARMLRLAGFKVSTALSAEAALREANARHPDAVMVDLRMPIVDGLGFVRRLRAQEDPRLTPVAVVTGDYFLDESVSAELRELGAAIYFKPLWLEDVVHIAERLTSP
jgi:DNA-binding response OmpR family regulator